MADLHSKLVQTVWNVYGRKPVSSYYNYHHILLLLYNIHTEELKNETIDCHESGMHLLKVFRSESDPPSTFS